MLSLGFCSVAFRNSAWRRFQHCASDCAIPEMPGNSSGDSCLAGPLLEPRRFSLTRQSDTSLENGHLLIEHDYPSTGETLLYLFGASAAEEAASLRWVRTE